jgi:hypothetical protein
MKTLEALFDLVDGLRRRIELLERDSAGPRLGPRPMTQEELEAHRHFVPPPGITSPAHPGIYIGDIPPGTPGHIEVTCGTPPVYMQQNGNSGLQNK